MPIKHNQYRALDSDDQLPDGDNAMLISLNHTSPEYNSPSRSSLSDQPNSSAYELIENPNIKAETKKYREPNDDAEQANDHSFPDSKRHQRGGETTFQPTRRFGWFLRPVQKIWWGKNCSGWRMTVALCILLTVVVLMVNVGITIWASKHKLNDGYRVLIENDCAKSKSWSRWSHLGINFISSLLLGASNYTMQCLVAPTRTEVDNAHRKGDWVDIGIPSLRNLSRISRRRVFIWLLLGLSSLPLHLLFNSAVFGVTSANSYRVAVVRENFAQEVQLNGTYPDDVKEYMTIEDRSNVARMLERIRVKNSTLEAFDSPEACIEAYRNPMISKRGNLLLVTADNSETTLFYHHDSYPIMDEQVSNDPLSWICGENHYSGTSACDVDHVLEQVGKGEPWILFTDKPIERCLSETFDEECRLQFSAGIMSVVIACNALKAVAMVLALFLLPEDPLATIGDAAASFLTDPDPNTEGHCLLSRSDMKSKDLRLSERRHPLKWCSRHRFWWSAASPRRWVVCIVLWLFTFITVFILLSVGITSLKGFGVDTNLASLWELGFGDVNTNSILRLNGGLDSTDKVLGYVLLANFPQIVLSFIYIMYSGLYTCMLLSHEWALYSTERKGLRTTYPRGQQRSTYYLQIPYAYSFPLIVASGLMHWLISQSIFLVSIDLYDVNHNPDKVVTAGYSCIAIIFTILLGSAMVIICVGLGARKYPPGIPLAASCSAAISAACHPPEKNADAAYLPVKWGEVPSGVDSNLEPEVGHCCLSSEEVIPPTPGRLYAGL